MNLVFGLGLSHVAAAAVRVVLERSAKNSGEERVMVNDSRRESCSRVQKLYAFPNLLCFVHSSSQRSQFSSSSQSTGCSLEGRAKSNMKLLRCICSRHDGGRVLFPARTEENTEPSETITMSSGWSWMVFSSCGDKDIERSRAGEVWMADTRVGSEGLRSSSWANMMSQIVVLKRKSTP